MNRSIYFNYIDEKLNLLALRIEKRGKLNLLDLNIHSETFFANLLNVIYGFSLKNLNALSHNVEGIDLVDEKNKIVAQVSSTCTKQKIEASLEKEILSKFKGYRFLFISIAKDAGDMRTKSFSNPHSVTFSPIEDIIDIPVILSNVTGIAIDKQKEVYDFVKKELGDDIPENKVYSNLAAIIDIIVRENLSDVPIPRDLNTFNIDEKIIFNNLTGVKDIIDEYKVFYSRLDEIYSEFDKQGMNKSNSVFRKIKSQYIELSNEYKDPCELFFVGIATIAEKVMNSENYVKIPIEELEMCTHILVVDAFIRCKIFKNPEGYSHVIT